MYTPLQADFEARVRQRDLAARALGLPLVCPCRLCRVCTVLRLLQRGSAAPSITVLAIVCPSRPISGSGWAHVVPLVVAAATCGTAATIYLPQHRPINHEQSSLCIPASKLRAFSSACPLQIYPVLACRSGISLVLMNPGGRDGGESSVV